MRESMNTAAVIEVLSQLRVMCCKLDQVATTTDLQDDIEDLHNEADHNLFQFEQHYRIADDRDFASVRSMQQALAEIASQLNVDIEHGVE